MKSKHPTAVFPAAESLFGSEAMAHNYVILNTWLRNPFDKPPKHLLAIPRDWQQKWLGDFPVEPISFTCRNAALMMCADANAAALETSMTGDGTPDEWHLIFRFGEWGQGSVLHVDGGKAELTIVSRVALVRPTQEETRRFGKH